MDTVYGTKKYFQSLSGASDIYRNQACRSMVNDYSYQNTLGRRSTVGAYYHMNKQQPYTNDHNDHHVSNQYGYNTWGIWRGEGRNIAPSTFSTKTHTHYQKTRSFSIILTTAAFIVLLAVISIAGLAFYFSSIKGNVDDPILAFEGSFRIAKGDAYAMGLKYNHTTTYKQKIDFYKRFIERALMDNNLEPMKVDVWGFGEGPLIKVSFRTIFDVRKLPQNINSVEEYIRQSLFMETTALKSLYRSLRLDAVEIKRILDEQLVKSATLFKETQSVPTSQTQLEKRLMKKGSPGVARTPSLISKPSVGGSSGTLVKTRTTTRTYQNTDPNHSPYDEPDVDVENAPVIQGSFEGSFEITKTDADIARRKTTPTRAYSSSLPPKAVTPNALTVKMKKPAVEKITTIIPQKSNTPTTSIIATTKITTTTTTTTRMPTTKTTAPETTTQNIKSTSSTTTTPKPLVPSTSQPQIIQNQFTFPSFTTASPTKSVPKLDTHLFTSFPILDTQPWRPIHREVPELLPGPPPAFPTKTIPINSDVPFVSKDIPQRRIDEAGLPFISNIPPPPSIAFNLYGPGFFESPIRKPDSSEEVGNAQDMIFYHSFGNPVFIPGTDDIERLGVGASVQPHPLPVPLIDDVVIPPFKPLTTQIGADNEDNTVHFTGDNKKFEHLGGGVIAKKKEESTTMMTNVNSSSYITQSTMRDIITNEESTSESSKGSVEKQALPTSNSELTDSLGEIFLDLLNLTKEEINLTSVQTPESRVQNEDVTDTVKTPIINTSIVKSTEVFEQNANKPNFMNLKEIILSRNQAANNNTNTNNHTKSPLSSPTFITTTTLTPVTTKWQRIHQLNTKTPTILDDSNLFPSHSQLELGKDSQTNNNMRKVFNKTLQAWVSEDIEKTENLTLDDIKIRINNATNIQDISLIFDTLASKLGITPSMPTKVPPFSNNKLKNTHRNESAQKVPPIQFTTKGTTTTIAPSSTFISTSLQSNTPNFLQREPFIRPMLSFTTEYSSSEGVGAAIPVVGEAEVEVIDPNKYEEMLKSSQFESTTTESAPKLVTLLPVRSNSGIRSYRPIEEIKRSNNDDITKPSSLVRSKITGESNTATLHRTGLIGKMNVNDSRRFPPAEAIIRGGLKVTVK